MIRAVLDTNVLVSGSVASSGTMATVIDAWRRGEYELIVSPQILQEIARALETPYFARRLDEDVRAEYLYLVRTTATVVSITAKVSGVATHEEDDLILATAVSGEADCLVTGDRHLQALRSFEGVQILSPRDFARVLRAGE